ncbi:MinD-like ATPase involved in chromosome partitioning or flagellar assembly [Spinactinospora alkalitolerans]|uniref:MinD-like ATPase involved in chromosome partitioning or flagellar assembly n=1 Tax=Spinactinospora alkalitolerans TaxID=687207 RepID=A0A852U0X1_9ACTN|nr:MinD/ParA family protein [Spinactinospora alkalitolerans]NYE49197.1 MinD-like ATPase involved in chromosome partitioning or flagellar assembly [Spinactinospora alkalitolerans]
MSSTPVPPPYANNEAQQQAQPGPSEPGAVSGGTRGTGPAPASDGAMAAPPRLPAGFDAPPSARPASAPDAPPPAPQDRPGPAAAGGDDRPAPGRTEDLTPDALLREEKTPPDGGWRRAVFAVTGGLVNPGDSKDELRRKELLDRVRTPVNGGHHRVAVLSLKGGVGKTTTTVGLGSVLAEGRGDRVVAVDANPDRGTLTERLPRELRSDLTVRDLLNDQASLGRYSDVRAYTSQAMSRLEFLASDVDPAVSEAFSDRDYRDVAAVVERFYSVCITDCGTGMLHAAMSAILALADQMVLVSPPSVDGSRSASATLDWLEAHDHGHLAKNAVVVISRTGKRSSIDLDRLESHFADRCRSVVRIPNDDHLEQGSAVDIDRLHPATRRAYLELAAEVAGGFAVPSRNPRLV